MVRVRVVVRFVQWSAVFVFAVFGIYFAQHYLLGGDGRGSYVVPVRGVSQNGRIPRVDISKPISNTSYQTRNDENHSNTNIGLPTNSTGEKNACHSVMVHYNISKTSFVMGLSYWEQLTMATNSMCALINFGRSWKSRTVLPFTLNAEFYGLPSTHDFPSITGTPPILKRAPTKPISILYDIDKFNSELLCEKYNLPPMATFNEFMRHANRQLIVMHINFFDVPPKSLFHGQSYARCEQNSKIKSVGNKLLKALNAEASKHKLASFELHSACCLNHMHIINSPLEISKSCGFSDIQDLALVFTVWRGYSDIPTKKFRLITSNSPLFNKPSPGRDAYPLSNGVQSNASAFVKYLSSCDTSCAGGRFVAVHLRTAKIAMMGGNAKERFRLCLDKVQTLLDSLKKNCTESSCKNMCRRYFVDYGIFGSHSYEVKMGEKASKSTLKERQIVPVHYNPGLHGGKQDQGFVALVEQLAMGHSDVLIMMGGGSFQEQIKNRFVQVGRGSRVYTVCHTKEGLTELVYSRKS